MEYDIEHVKYVIEKGLDDNERFIFLQFFEGYELSVLKSFFVLSESGLPARPRSLRRTLANACLKFILFTKSCPKIVKLFKQCLSYNTYKRDIRYILASRKKKKGIFVYIYKAYQEYYKLCDRVFA